PLAGAALLWLTDRLVQVTPFTSEIPAGVATAFLGAPLLFLLLPKLRTSPDRDGAMLFSVRRRSGWAHLLAGLVVMALLLCAALVVGRGAAGWHLASAAELADLLPLRAPRVAVAVSAGMMLGVAGTLMQRMTGNPMAAPEVLGVSGGASLGILLLFVATSDVSRPAMIAGGLVGALASLAMVSQTGRRQPIANDRLLLSGAAVATMASAFSAVMLASGDPRLDTLIGWLSGSTYRATAVDATIAAV
ncbi:iron chelate uptake ABC transporter family permease subunit, partial [Mesorhizobium sp.]|uniref:iron chelate uptake ABC transporter family permease subunit n=1 Tax=Mesorhizobium sp. TaxID=1871066 RepID=UPI0025F2EC74